MSQHLTCRESRKEAYDLDLSLQGNAQSRKRQDEDRRQQQYSYFSNIFANQRQRSQQQHSGDSKRRKYGGPDEGPVIDVEYTTIDEQ